VLVEQLRAANAGLREVIAGQAMRLEAQAAQIAELRRQLEKDSSTSGRRWRAGRAQYGPGVLARAAELLCGHYLPVARATGLMASLVGVRISTGFMAGVRRRAAALLETTFLPRVRQLLCEVGVLHADETPRAGGRRAGLRARRLDPAPDRDAHRWAVQGRHRRRASAARGSPARSCVPITPATPTSSTPSTPGVQLICCGICARSTGPTPTASSGPRRWPTPW
jgi:transposase